MPAAAVLAGVVVLAGCGSGTDSGGLKKSDRVAAQLAMNALQTSNLPTQLVALSSTAGLPPAACRVHLESTKPKTFKVYVFWIPYVGPQGYSWLQMTLTKNAAEDTFHYGTAPTVLPGGTQLANGQTVVPPVDDYDTPLSQYGPQQDRKNQQVLMAHAGNVFSKPGANCQLLQNGYLRLLPNP